jgi:hypothetical protein
MEQQMTEKPVVEAWLSKITLALKKKDEEFGQFARECAKFYDGPADWMWQDEKTIGKERGWLSSGASLPNFRIQINKPFEAVALFGPSLFHQYPNILVNPVQRPQVLPEALGVDFNDPYAAEQYQAVQMQQQMDMAVRQTHANIGGGYLNTVQRIADKKRHSREGIVDGMVRGLGLLHTKIYSPPGSSIRYPRSERINECDYVKDSDATRHDDVQWIAVRCIAPKNKVAEQYGLHEDDLKGHFQSHGAQATKQAKKEANNGKGGDNKSFDLVEYWEIYSKNGFGDKLTTFSGKHVNDYSAFGPFCYLVVAKGVPFPLNLPPWAHEEEPDEILKRVSWPIPYWIPPLCDWPVTELGFYWKGGSTYPVPMFKPLIGPIRFVNWCLSFLADKCASAGTDYIAAVKSAATEIKNQLEQGVGPYKLLELPQEIVAAAGGDINKMVSVIQSPNFQEGLWRMVSEMMVVIDRESGVNELLAGMTSTQMRSAEEASVKQANTQIRPDDMAQRVEDWLTLTAKKEMLAAHWVLTGEDMAPVIGDEAAYVWENQMATQDVERIISDFEYTIEAGSARKPNIANRQRAISDFMQANGAMLQELAMGGMPGPLNAAITVWGDVNQLDVSQFLLQPPDPNAPQPPSEEEIKLQTEQAKLGMDQERMQMDMAGKQAELEMKAVEHQQDLAFDAARFTLEMKHDAAKSKQDLAIQKQKGQAAVQAQKAKARATPSKNGSKA